MLASLKIQTSMLQINSTIGHAFAISCLIVSMFAFVPYGSEGLDSVEVAVASVVIEAEDGKLLNTRRSVKKRVKRARGVVSVCDPYASAADKRCRFFFKTCERDSINGSGCYLRI